MKTVVFDIETDGLLDTLTQIHCISAKCAETGQMVTARSTEPSKMGKVVKAFEKVDRLVAHNLFRFDLPVLERFYPDLDLSKVQLIDTLILGQLVYPRLRMTDAQRVKKGFPKNLVGSHSLKAWGIRLGNHKGDFSENTDWKELSEEMVVYCEQDVNLLCDLFTRMEAKAYSPQAIDIEMRFARVISLMEQRGFTFNINAAEDLNRELLIKRAELSDKLKQVFPNRFVPVQNGKTFVNKRNRTKKHELNGHTWKERFPTGCEFCKIKEEVFNPNSRAQIGDRLIQKYGWEPTKLTETGQPKIDESVLKDLDWPEAEVLKESLMVTKRLSQVSEGSNGWLKLYNPKTKAIHGRVNTVGTQTRRCSHSRPNLAQIPAVRQTYGTECRSLFTVPPGYKQVGADMSGLELRMLAHYLATWDKGKYGDVVLNSDIHTYNQEAAGLPTRDMAKTMIYGLIYGAGDAKLGKIVDGGQKEGAEIRANIMAKIPALKKLSNALKAALKKRDYIKTIDGGMILVESEHKALNYLLQSSGSISVKLWTCLVYERLISEGYKWGDDFYLSATCHDESQWAVREEHAEYVARVNEEEAVRAGEILKTKIPLAAEAKIGMNWAECH